MSVRIDNGPDLDTPLPELPEKYRSLHGMLRIGDALRSMHTDCRQLKRVLDELEAVQWAGFGSREAFIKEEMRVSVETIDYALEGLVVLDLSRPVTLEQARKEGAKLRAHGGDRRSEKVKEQADNISLKQQHGTSSAYLAARLERDEPDIKAALDRGEYPSVRAAAKAAGIVRDKPPIEHLRKWWRKASQDERNQFGEEIAELIRMLTTKDVGTGGAL